MKCPSLKISERQQVLLIIPAAVAAVAVIWFLVLRPQFERRNEIESLKSQLANSPYANKSMEDLSKILKHERELGARTEEEWDNTVTRLATFAKPPKGDVTRIDYKRELFDARMRLARRSEELNVQLVPRDLGLREALGANDAMVRTRMLQLQTVEKLVDIVLSRQVFKLHTIEPLAPVSHKGQDKKSSLTEFPVDIDFEVSFDDLYLFFQSIFEEQQTYVLRNIRISAGTVPSAPLRVRTVMSAIIFE